MAGTIIADKIQTENSFLTLNVGQTQVATMNASGIYSPAGVKMIGSDGSITALTRPTLNTGANVTFSNTSSAYINFGSVATPVAASIGGYDDGSSNGHFEIYTANNSVVTEQVRVTANGMVGFGTIPAGWGTDYRAIQVGKNGAFWSGNNSNDVVTRITHNAYAPN